MQDKITYPVKDGLIAQVSHPPSRRSPPIDWGSRISLYSSATRWWIRTCADIRRRSRRPEWSVDSRGFLVSESAGRGSAPAGQRAHTRCHIWFIYSAKLYMNVRWTSGVTKLDGIRNENIRATKVGKIYKKVQENRLRWFRCVMRREKDCVGSTVMGDRTTREEEVGKAEMEMIGQCENRSQGEGTVGGGSVWLRRMEANAVVRRPYSLTNMKRKSFIEWQTL